MEIGKLEEEKIEEISGNKENTSQNSKNYLELKHGKKIQVLNGACLKDSLNNQMPTSKGLVGNEPVIF